mmetsp:Transcript_75772/g.231932  ORF Transcript_75772/g.231932 Transcript_75772/m.231932 type:complete len:684 (+) Transcript_75772:1520-3571(+)
MVVETPRPSEQVLQRVHAASLQPLEQADRQVLVAVGQAQKPVLGDGVAIAAASGIQPLGGLAVGIGRRQGAVSGVLQLHPDRVADGNGGAILDEPEEEVRQGARLLLRQGDLVPVQAWRVQLAQLELFHGLEVDLEQPLHQRPAVRLAPVPRELCQYPLQRGHETTGLHDSAGDGAVMRRASPLHGQLQRVLEAPGEGLLGDALGLRLVEDILLHGLQDHVLQSVFDGIHRHARAHDDLPEGLLAALDALGSHGLVGRRRHVLGPRLVVVRFSAQLQRGHEVRRAPGAVAHDDWAAVLDGLRDGLEGDRAAVDQDHDPQDLGGALLADFIRRPLPREWNTSSGTLVAQCALPPGQHLLREDAFGNVLFEALADGDLRAECLHALLAVVHEHAMAVVLLEPREPQVLAFQFFLPDLRRLHDDHVAQLRSVALGALERVAPLGLARAERRDADARHIAARVVLVHGLADQVHDAAVRAPGDDPGARLLGRRHDPLAQVRLHSRLDVHAARAAHNRQNQLGGFQIPHVCISDDQIEQLAGCSLLPDHAEAGHEPARELHLAELGRPLYGGVGPPPRVLRCVVVRRRRHPLERRLLARGVDADQGLPLLVELHMAHHGRRRGTHALPGEAQLPPPALLRKHCVVGGAPRARRCGLIRLLRLLRGRRCRADERAHLRHLRAPSRHRIV